MYEAFYGFKEKPFTLTPDPRYFYASHVHRDALDHLLYGIREREGFIVITGDVGTGKTTLCRAILSQIGEETRTAVILNPVLSEEELLRAVLHDFGLSAAGRTKNELVGELNAFLIESLTADRRVVLVVDEAQNLSRELLEQIRLLSNLETERDKLIQIVMVGQLELLTHLDSPELKQLNQRVSVRYSLTPLSFAETCQYVYHRLMVAGGTSGVSFDTGALRAIYRYSQGIPRLINLAADRALLQGFANQSRQIGRRTAKAGISSLRDRDPRRRRPRMWLVRELIAVLVGAALAGGAAAWLQRHPLGAQAEGPVSVPIAVRRVDILRDYRVSIPGAIQSPGVEGKVLSGVDWLPVDAPATPASWPSASAADASARFAVLVGTFATQPDARAVERRLVDGGYATMVAQRSLQPGGDGYGVLVGPLRDLVQAQQVRDGLAGQYGFVGVRIVRMVGDLGSSKP